MRKDKPKIVAIVGPTASGKSELAIIIARKFGGEVISADSRQVYKGLDVATNKLTPDEMRGIPHHLIDVLGPEESFGVNDFKRLAEEKVRKIISRGKLPIVAGGTGYYIDALLYNQKFPEVPPNKKLREKLKNKSPEELAEILKKLDERRYKEIDKKNPRRLIRAIEIAKKLGEVPKQRKGKPFECLIIGLDLPDDELRENIERSVLKRVKQGVIEEAQALRNEGLTLERMRELGLEYGALADYLEGKLEETELIEKIKTLDWQYAKRQRQWFRRSKDITWFHPRERSKILSKIQSFLNK